MSMLEDDHKIAAAALAPHRLLWQEPLQHPDMVPCLLSILNTREDLMRSGVLWVYCGRTFETVSPMVSLVEGLTLLALLNETNTAAWLDELKLTWTTERDADWIDDNLNEDSKPCAVGLNVVVHRDVDFDMVDKYITIQDYDTDFHRTKFGSILSSVDKRVKQPTVPVCVELDVEDNNTTRLRVELYRLFEIVEMRYEPDIEDAGDAQPLRLARMLITEVRVGSSIDAKDLRSLIQLGERGVAIPHLPQLYAKPATPITCALVSSLQALLLSESTKFEGVRSVTVSDDVPSRHLHAVLSGLQDSQSVKTVCLTMNRDVMGEADEEELEQRASMWALIASTLWCPQSTHRISKLELALNDFTANEFESFRSAYQSQNGLLAAATDGTMSRKPGQVITARRFSLMDPSKTNDEASSEDRAAVRDPTASRYTGAYEDEDDEYDDSQSDSSDDSDDALDDSSIFFESSEPLHVYKVGDEQSDDSEWRAVVLPGAGHAWVYRDDILGISNENQQRSSRGFPQISVSKMSWSSMDMVADFICLVGRDTQRLTVEYLHSAAEDTAIDDWCVRVLSASRRLERLELVHVRVNDLRLLVQCVGREGVRLRSLSLGFVDAVSLDHVRDVFETLCDSNHPFTTHLQELSLVLVVRDEEQLVQPFLSLLQQNRTLHTISIGFRHGYRVEQVHLSIASRERIIACAQEKVSVRTGPVDLCSKLAFISVVHGEFAPRSSCRSAIDTSILSIIFQLAAPSRIRRARFLNR